ncbi:hypothetical protein BT69DRAFT_1290415 [Atractiella rhizophila]|nr:hypothetical protein BT69DRAFT_1290415 [Atractiella rhizophila]
MLSNSTAQVKPKKEFKCPDCSKSYSRKEFVERHRRLQHLDERPFECTQCQSAAFSRSDLLKRHLKTCPGKATLNPDGSVKVRKKRRIAKDAPRGNQDSSESPTQREGENTQPISTRVSTSSFLTHSIPQASLLLQMYPQHPIFLPLARKLLSLEQSSPQTLLINCSTPLANPL